jgi:hypothetical protein
MLDEERDYWRPRIAVHFGAQLLKWAMLDFGQGTPAFSSSSSPTAREQTFRAFDMWATIDCEELWARAGFS